MGVLLAILEKAFKIKLPSSTKARKIGAARHLGARENALLSTQMSHNQQIHQDTMRQSVGVPKPQRHPLLWRGCGKG